MRTLFAVVLLSLLVGLSAAADAQTRPAAPHKAEAAHTSAPRTSGLTKDMALVGGAVLGLVVASGIVNLVNAGTMIYGGTAIADALESGAGLAMPVALLGAALGAVFGQETIVRNINWLTGAEAAKGGH
ncbi:MAG: hypothetical protein WCO00_14150 [Rhodospirillaceae bacterium]